MSKGVNKDANSLKQAQRLEFHDLRDVHTQIEIEKREAERQKDEEEAEEAPHTGVVLRGWRSLDDALPNLQNDLAARICHLVRESVQAQVQKVKAGEARDGAQHDLDALIELLPPQSATRSGACTHLWALNIVYTSMRISPVLALGGICVWWGWGGGIH